MKIEATCPEYITLADIAPGELFSFWYDFERRPAVVPTVFIKIEDEYHNFLDLQNGALKRRGPDNRVYRVEGKLVITSRGPANTLVSIMMSYDERYLPQNDPNDQ